MAMDIIMDILDKEVTMALINPFIAANQGGIPRLASTNVSVSSTEIRFNFNSHPFLSRPFAGLIIFKLNAIPSGTTETLPLVFDLNEKNITATTIGGVELTAADITGAGIYLAFYDNNTNTLQLLTGI
jgi:hypothetical protein